MIYTTLYYKVYISDSYLPSVLELSAHSVEAEADKNAVSHGGQVEHALRHDEAHGKEQV